MGSATLSVLERQGFWQQELTIVYRIFFIIPGVSSRPSCFNASARVSFTCDTCSCENLIT
jgi:hypothetical protein